MNADRIVIEHGEVIEQGSHHVLLGKNGRYADLWSKQIFPKPRERKDMMEIVDRTEAADDLSSEQTAADHYKGGTTDSDSEVFFSDQEQAQEEGEAPRRHRKEGSKLNPVAPEFTPRTMAMSKSGCEDKLALQDADVSAEEFAGAAPGPFPSCQWSYEVTE